MKKNELITPMCDYLAKNSVIMMNPQIIYGDNNVQVSGNASSVNAGTFGMVMAEISKVHDLMGRMLDEYSRQTAKMQEQMDRLITIIENRQGK